MLGLPKKSPLKAKNLKCFGEELQGYERLEKVNVIIGRNNSGKSTLIDLIEYAIKPNDEQLRALGHKNAAPEVYFTFPITETNLQAGFRRGVSGGGVPGSDHFAFAAPAIGKHLTAKLTEGEVIYMPENDDLFAQIPQNVKHDYCKLIARNNGNPFRQMKFRKLSAERDIVTEPQTPGQDVTVTETGVGATRAIQAFLSYRHLDQALIENDLLNALNEVFNPDSYFERITAHQDQGNQFWEIYLHEGKKGGRIALSNSGSGLKTIMLVLINLILMPAVEKQSLERYVFAFEELENNLHPALQKRLFEYLYKQALEKGCHFFFTTHSNVVIDLFANREDAQLLHVKHNGESATVQSVDSYGSKTEVLNDMEFRASDLLQSNGLVWVEGPTDRMYFNKWVELYSNGKLKEGIHYQCVIYGGVLKAHLSAEDPDLEDKAIAVFNVNRNAILLTDSDRAAAGARLKTTVIRLRTELGKWSRSLCFITEGREVENYIPVNAVRVAFSDDSIREMKQYEGANDYLAYLRRKTGIRSLNKVTFAEKVLPHIAKEDLDQQLGLKRQMRKVVDTMTSWNSQGADV